MKLAFRKKTAPPPRRRANTGRLEEEGNKFRRSATLTGTLSDQVRAGAEDRGQLQSARMEAQSQRKRRRRLMRQIMIASGLVVVAIFLFLNRVSTFNIQFYNDPVHMPATAAYIKTAKDFSGSSPSNRFTFGLNAHNLEQYLIAHHREIDSVKVTRRLFSTAPELDIALRRPVLIWQTSHDTQAFYVDASGISFSFNAYSDGESKLVHVNDESGVPSQLGVPVATSRQISFLGQLVGQVVNSSTGQLNIAKIVFPPSSTKEIDVYLQGKPYFAKVYLDRSGKAQAEELVSATNYFQQKNITPGQYVDVRVQERVFYK